MSRKVAFLFPGQGSQCVGMGEGFYRTYDRARGLFEQADQVLGFNLSSLCFHGPAEELALTCNTQPAVLLVSVAACALLRDHGVEPWMAAGHSLGEYTGLVAAGVLNFATAVELVRKRGVFMQEAVPPGKGAMAAILGLPAELVGRLCGQVDGQGVVECANFNSPEQVVVSGEKAAVEALVDLARGEGGKAMLLPVSAPFHCQLMRPAEERLAREVERVAFGDLAFPIVANVGAQVIRTGDEAKAALIQQVSAPVCWEESMRVLQRRGVEAVVEVGPGKVLGGLWRRIDRGVPVFSVGDPEGLQRTVEALA